MNNANERMITAQILSRGVRSERVIEAFRSVPRSLFVPDSLIAAAYDDAPQPIGFDQTISQPYIVAFMTELLRLKGDERVLEIGTGSGYQTAILARLAQHVWSAELESVLSAGAASHLRQLDIRNVTLGVGDGMERFREQGPFDAILSAAAPVVVPEELVEQLAEGGRCVIPAGEPSAQGLWLIERLGGMISRHRTLDVRFVPLRRPGRSVQF